MNFLRVRVVIFTVCVAFASLAAVEDAQALDSVFLPATGDWNNINNWDTGNVPAATFEQRAIIEGGSAATLASVPPAVGGVVLGLTAGSVGTLTINPGGTLTSQVSASTNGVVNVGIAGGGNGTLNMTGGTLNANAGLLSGNSTLNVIDLSGSATINMPNAQLGGTTRVTGPTVNFNAANFTLQGPSTLVAGITGATHSRLKATGIATVAGVLNVAFTGVTPAFGQSWDIVDASAIAGNFTNAGNVGVTGIPAPGLGDVYRVTRTTGGTFGQVLRLSREKALVLQVNRDTGAMAIINPQDGAIPIEAYQIRSAAGSLEPGTWNSFTDQSTANWEEGFASGNGIGELNYTSTFNFAGVPSKTLGNAYDDGNAFFSNGIGASGADLVFTYSVPSIPTAITGQIQYVGTGRTNTLLLSIDPATGAAVLKNDAPGTITIEGYSILSNATALLPGGFNDAATPTLTAVPGSLTTSAISELITNPASPLAIAGNSTYSLGNIFNTAALQTGITLEFGIPGQNVVFNGAVRFEAAATGVLGDYSGNGIVDAADYTLWRNNLGGAPTSLLRRDPINPANNINTADYNFWKSRFGATSGSGGASLGGAPVPEPSAGLLLLVGMALAASNAGRRG